MTKTRNVVYNGGWVKNVRRIVDRELRQVEKHMSKQKKISSIRSSIGISKLVNKKNGPSILFLPYKAAMWDSLESIWEAACKVPGAQVTVMPIPYYGKDKDGQMTEMHYEGADFPSEVPVTDWRGYDIAQEHPDIIFIQIPYDTQNAVTSVHQAFYAATLRIYTNNLIYVPYFVLPSARPEMLVLSNGTVESDFTFVQGQAVKDFYLLSLPQEVAYFAPDEDRLQHIDWSKKIIPIGSPKTDRVLKEIQRQRDLPVGWAEAIAGRQTVFLNTNVNMIMKGKEGFLANLRRIFKVFADHSDKWAVIWREHPLTMETIRAKVPQIEKEYMELREEFLSKGLGLIDETHDPYAALRISDAYFGAGGSMSLLYALTGKPLMVTSYAYPRGISKKTVTLEKVLTSEQGRFYALDRNVNTQALFLENMPAFVATKENRLREAKKFLANTDGSVGRKIMHFIMKHGKGLK